jgi:hypothetical protein
MGSAIAMSEEREDEEDGFVGEKAAAVAVSFILGERNLDLILEEEGGRCWEYSVALESTRAEVVCLIPRGFDSIG